MGMNVPWVGRGALGRSGSLLMNFPNPSRFMGSDLPYRITRVWVGSAEQLHPPGVCGASIPSPPKFRVMPGLCWAGNSPACSGHSGATGLTPNRAL